jgi:hypothetical protein
MLTISLDPNHLRHLEIVRAIQSLPANSARYVSAIGLAELAFGADLAKPSEMAMCLLFEIKYVKLALLLFSISRITPQVYTPIQRQNWL